MLLWATAVPNGNSKQLGGELQREHSDSIQGEKKSQRAVWPRPHYNEGDFLQKDAVLLSSTRHSKAVDAWLFLLHINICSLV